MLVSFDIKFVGRDQKQRRNSDVCRASPMFFWSSLINRISKATNMFFSFIMLFLYILRHKKRQRSEEQTFFVRLNLRTSRMHYDVSLRRHLRWNRIKSKFSVFV